LVTKVLYLIQKFFFMKKDLEPAVKFGDNSLARLNILSGTLYEFEIPSNNGIEIYGMKFPSPLIGSSFKSDPNILDIWMKMGLGGLIFKTIMRNKRIGNPYPRLQDAYFNKKSGLFNSLGLPGMGVTDFLEYLKNTELWKYERPLGISIGGDDENEYLSNLLELDPFLKTNNKPYFYELNISCPNVPGEEVSGDFSRFLNPERKWCSIKLSPLVKPETIEKLYGQGFRQFHCSNTLPVINGGLSGKSLIPYTYRTISQLKQYPDVKIIAGGGITSREIAELYLNHGAHHLSVSSVLFNPWNFMSLYAQWLVQDFSIMKGFFKS